jgi:hypothetical protein
MQFSGQESLFIKFFLEQLDVQVQMQGLKDNAQQLLLFLTGLTDNAMVFFKGWKDQIFEDKYSYKTA